MVNFRMDEDLKKNMASNVVKSFITDMKSLGFNSLEIIELINETAKEIK